MIIIGVSNGLEVLLSSSHRTYQCWYHSIKHVFPWLSRLFCKFLWNIIVSFQFGLMLTFGGSWFLHPAFPLWCVSWTVSIYHFRDPFIKIGWLWEHLIFVIGSFTSWDHGKTILSLLWEFPFATLAQVMACCLTAWNHYLNHCWKEIIIFPRIDNTVKHTIYRLQLTLRKKEIKKKNKKVRLKLRCL